MENCDAGHLIVCTSASYKVPRVGTPWNCGYPSAWINPVDVSQLGNGGFIGHLKGDGAFI